MDPHQVHFMTIALPKFVEALMKRDYSDKEYHPLVANEFFKNVLSMIAKYACQFPQHSIVSLLSSLLSPTKFKFYTNYGVVRPGQTTQENSSMTDNADNAAAAADISGMQQSVVTSIDDEVWKEILAIGDTCDFLDNDCVFQAKVKAISPYNTEMELEYPNTARPSSWMSKCDPRVYQQGTGHFHVTSDSVDSEDEKKPLEEWRVSLVVNSPIDFKDSTGAWFQAVVLEIEDEKVRTATTDVGRRVKVYWPDDVAWYNGTVLAYDGVKRVIEYDDGEQETLDLADQKYEWLTAAVAVAAATTTTNVTSSKDSKDELKATQNEAAKDKEKKEEEEDVIYR